MLPRVLVSGGFHSDELTPLEEQYAPDLIRLPAKIQRQMRVEFWNRLGDASEAERETAGDWVATRTDELMTADLSTAFDLEEIETRARNCARVCEYIKDIEDAEVFCRARGIDPPKDGPNTTRRGRLMRCRSHRWWRAQLDKHRGRRAENAMRRIGMVCRARELYASDLTVSQRRYKTGITDRWVKERICVSDSGEQVELWDVRQKSQANPTLRRNELMVCLRGFSEVAETAGHVADFYTLTTPSRFHPMLATGGHNPEYTGGAVRDAQAWLRGMWAKARAKLKRLKVLIYGFRIAEPHHDGTPHWHMVLFTLPGHREIVRTVLRGYWLSDGGSDRGAQDHRITVTHIDGSKGSAAGYLAKYVAKNIDGFEVGDDYESVDGSGSNESGGKDAKGTCDRVTAWATRHGIRQFQQIGGPAVTVWRELRRIRSDCGIQLIEAARVHADAGEWAAFISALGGIEAGRAGSVGLWTRITGEINQYDELRGPQIAGVQSGVLQVETRIKVWRIQKRPALTLSALGPVSITVRDGGGFGAPLRWTNPNESSMYGPH